MQKLVLLVSLFIFPMVSMAVEHCGVVKKVEKTRNSGPEIQFEDGMTVEIYDNWTMVNIATTAFVTKARTCVDGAGTISIEK